MFHFLSLWILEVICFGSHAIAYNVPLCLLVIIVVWCSLVFGASIMQDRDLTEYSPSVSSTSKHLSCSHEFCELGPNCKSPKQPCPYIANYFSENTSSSGFLVEDTLHLATTDDHANKSLVHAPIVIGCGRKQTGGYLDGIAPNGLIGLGLGDVSVPSVLAKAGLMHNSFSLCFNEDDSGRIFFGDQGAATQQSTPFLPLNEIHMSYMVEVEGYCIGSSCLKQSGFQAQFDSGTSFTFLPDEVYKKVSVEFDKRVNVKRTSYEGSPWEYCYEASSQELHKIPNMTLKFNLNNSFVVHNPFFLVYEDQVCSIFDLSVSYLRTEGVTYGLFFRMDTFYNHCKFVFRLFTWLSSFPFFLYSCKVQFFYIFFHMHIDILVVTLLHIIT
ncbi:hypothetical protein AQUCO_00800086v1 [Aquilegia coerulea]|uniref:Peptidase A1 domain-containing protein n=1 Tax=Aquilegia coerulea TaxID=218851 RepID=A0A2G5EH59_AQUCA|nr:hypothetical protein AQUCO_00800086v1 [Aquilegia coerulea]